MFNFGFGKFCRDTYRYQKYFFLEKKPVRGNCRALGFLFDLYCSRFLSSVLAITVWDYFYANYNAWNTRTSSVFQPEKSVQHSSQYIFRCRPFTHQVCLISYWTGKFLIMCRNCATGTIYNVEKNPIWDKLRNPQNGRPHCNSSHHTTIEPSITMKILHQFKYFSGSQAQAAVQYSLEYSYRGYKNSSFWIECYS